MCAAMKPLAIPDFDRQDQSISDSDITAVELNMHEWKQLDDSHYINGMKLGYNRLISWIQRNNCTPHIPHLFAIMMRNSISDDDRRSFEKILKIFEISTIHQIYGLRVRSLNAGKH